jgi:hypothetical protein
MSAVRQKHTVESLTSEAIKYKTRGEFSKLSRKAYDIAWQRGILDDICGHMSQVLQYHTIESLTEEALKYKTKEDFKKESHNCHGAATRLGIMDAICGHMDILRKDHTIDSLTEEALKYKSRVEFRKLSQSCYVIANRRGILDLICGHMVALNQYHTVESLTAEALKYKTRNEFYKLSHKAYDIAHRRGILDNICGHMERDKGGFNPEKPGILYYIRFDHQDEGSVWKIGITNRDAKSRLNGISPKQGWTATILQSIYFNNGSECYEMEQSLHAEFEEYSYKGPSVLKSGNTELFTCNVLGL